MATSANASYAWHADVLPAGWLVGTNRRSCHSRAAVVHVAKPQQARHEYTGHSCPVPSDLRYAVLRRARSRRQTSFWLRGSIQPHDDGAGWSRPGTPTSARSGGRATRLSALATAAPQGNLFNTVSAITYKRLGRLPLLPDDRQHHSRHLLVVPAQAATSTWAQGRIFQRRTPGCCYQNQMPRLPHLGYHPHQPDRDRDRAAQSGKHSNAAVVASTGAGTYC